MQIIRQLLDADLFALRYHASIPENVFQLTDVSRPRVMRDYGLSTAREIESGFVIVFRKTIQEMPLQQGKVFPAVGKARELQVDHGKPVVEVFAELVVGD